MKECEPEQQNHTSCWWTEKREVLCEGVSVVWGLVVYFEVLEGE